MSVCLSMAVCLCVSAPFMAVCHEQRACAWPSQLSGEAASERHEVVVDGSLPLLLLFPLAEVHADAALFRAQIAVQIRCVKGLLLLAELPSAPRDGTPCRLAAQHHQQQQTALTPRPQQPLDGRQPHWCLANNNNLSNPLIDGRQSHWCPANNNHLLLLQAGSTRSRPTCWPRCTAYRRARTGCTT